MVSGTGKALRRRHSTVGVAVLLVALIAAMLPQAEVASAAAMEPPVTQPDGSEAESESTAPSEDETAPTTTTTVPSEDETASTTTTTVPSEDETASTTTTTVAPEDETTPPTAPTSTTRPPTSADGDGSSGPEPPQTDEASPSDSPEPAAIAPMAIAENTFHEITAGWQQGTPAQVPYGEVVTAEFRVNTNDAGQPPLNNDATNVTVTLTATGGMFDSLPVICDTTGVTPPSSISPDGFTMICNMGTIVEGNSTIVRAPVRATDLDGGPIQVEGWVDSDTAPNGPFGPATNSPLPITYTNGMDLQLDEAPGRGIQGRNITGFDGTERREIVMNFSLSLLDGSTPGPATYSFPFTVARTDGGGPTSVRFEGGIDGANDCVPVSNSTRALQHPFSDPARVDRTNFPTCTITGSGTNYTLTVSGLDYSFANVPANDSFGNALPQDRTYIASASVRFSVPGTVGGASYEFSAPNAPNFNFARGAPASYVDNKANNTGSLTITAPGGFSNAWYGTLTHSRTTWDDNLWLNQGAGTATQNDIYHQVNNRFWEGYAGPGGLIAGSCTMHSSTNFVADYVDFGAWTTGVGYNTDPIDSARLFYTTGPIDTRTHNCDAGNWIEIPVPTGYLTGNPNDPANLFPVPANAVGVKVLWDPTESYEGYLFLRMFGSISPNAPIGGELWTSSAYTHPNDPGVWYNRSDDPAVNTATATPWSNYVNNHPGTNGYRDVMRIQGYSGVITKEAQSGSAVPGQPVTYELTAEAQTTTLNPPPTTITVVDQLPIGLEYVPGTGSPTPTVTGTAATGQTLRFSIPNAAANTEYPITYEAQIPPDVALAPDTRLTNVATINVPGDSRPVASRQARDTITVPSQAATQLLKTVVDPRLNWYGDTSAWTMTITSSDPEPSAFTDTIDLLPEAGDPRGTNTSGAPPYTITGVTAPAGSTVYYTTEPQANLVSNPRHPSNGTYPAAGNPVPSAIWSTTAVPNPTAIRVIGPELPPGGVQTIAIEFATPSGTECLEPVAGENRPGEVLVNSATSVAEETALRMLSSAETRIGGCVDFDKEAGGLSRNADGTYTVDYTLTATGVGDVLPYDLTDTLLYGDAITVSGQPTATFIPQDETQLPVAVLNTWDPATSTLTVAEDVPIADGEIQVFEVSVDVSVDGGAVTWENTNCALDGNESGTGLLNEATLSNPDVTIPDETCPEVPYVEHEKTVSDGPTPIGDGLYEVEYTIDVRNLGAGSSVYDLVDDFQFGEAITIEGAPTVTNTVPGDITPIGTWDADESTIAIVDGVPIAGSTVDGPEVHTYVVTVQVSVDAEEVTFANSDCTMGSDESGTGLYNESTLTVDEHEEQDEACPPISEPVHEKTVSDGPTPIGDGLYEVEYTITVSNHGAADSSYDLIDDFQFGEAITIEGAPTVTNTVPGDITPIGTWDADTSTLAIVDDEAILAGEVDGPEVHEYVVAVQVSVDAGAITFSNSDCTMGEDEAGTGLFNMATMTVNDEPADRDACPEISEPVHTKELSAGPTRLDSGNFAVEYTIVVSNHGAADSAYDLDDEFRFGEHVVIETTPVVTNTVPGDIDTIGTWDPDATTIAVVEDQPIVAGSAEAPAVHEYVITLEVSSDAGLVTEENANCSIGAGESGSGLFNVATLTVNDEDTEADTCEQFPRPELDVRKVVDATSLMYGDTLSYTVTITNTGQLDFTEASPAEAVDDLTDVLDDAAWVGDAAASVGSLSFAAPTLEWQGPLAVDESVTITYTVRANPTLTGSGTLYNTVGVLGETVSNCPATDPAEECETSTQLVAAPAGRSPITPNPIPVTG